MTYSVNEKSGDWHRIRDRERAKVTYRFRVRVRVRLMVRDNFYVHFADGVFDISIFSG